MASIRGAAPEVSMMSSSRVSMAGLVIGPPPRQGYRLGFGAGGKGGEQVAEPLAAGDPGGVHEGGQSEEFRAIAQPGGPQPAGVQPWQACPACQRGDQRCGHVRRRDPPRR